MSYIGNSPGVASQRVVTNLTATSGQTRFVAQSGYTLGYIDVLRNGIDLVLGEDYTATDGIGIDLTVPATAGDKIKLVAYIPRGLSDGWTKDEADARFINTSGDSVNLNGLTINTGTSNGVAYLNGSKVLTTGSNLTYDNVTLYANVPIQVQGTNAIQFYDANYSIKASTGLEITTLNFTRFLIGAAEQMRLTSTGLGVGTSSPGSKLSINSSAIYGGGTTNENTVIISGTPPSADTTRGIVGIYDQTSAAAGVGGSLTLGGSYTGTTPTFFAGIKGVKTNSTAGDATGDLLLAPRGGNTIFYGAMYSTERMRIDSSGNVGINTSSPSSFGKFAVASTDNQITATTGTNSFTFRTNSSEAALYTFQAIPLNFYTNNTERMRIDSSGNLLVGTTTASARFVVTASSNSTYAGQIRSDISGDVAQAPFLIAKYDNNSTTSQVFARFATNEGATASGQINANGASQAAFGSWSDARLKENIETLPPQLANICSLRPVEFDYIESEGGGHQIGFIAQEMQEVYPDAVGERQPDGMLTVTGWSKTEARLVKAIQELKAELDATKAEVAALKGK